MATLNPLPQSLKGECDKAAKILREFTIPSSKAGADKLIPKTLLSSCKGLAIITVIKMGFLFTMRAGSGLIIARLPNGEWSAPSAVALGGMGGGLEIGGEITNFVIVLNTKSAVTAFSKGGNVTIGGNMSVAAGPMGRNIEADVSIRSPAAIYTYSRTRGLFIGMSIEGSVLMERKGANRKIYGQDVRAKSLLTGVYPPPQEAANLYRALSDVSGGTTAVMAHRASNAFEHAARGRNSSFSSSSRRNTASYSDAPPRPSRSRAAMSRLKQGLTSVRNKASSNSSSSNGGSKKTGFSRSDAEYDDGHTPAHGFFASVNKQGSTRDRDPAPRTRRPAAGSTTSDSLDWSNPTAKALFDFEGTMPCDLSFRKGAVIEVLTRTDTHNDWWEGRIFDRVGIFPANYVKMQS
ncbi:Sh3yl1-prov protein [Salpingoeca rosetta]|uniref:SH3 domain-containing YSC84-like protein 1 n=1 Tax=Salpingoeca rosetta (strain ATCC 50818 / BSB-021) TaxID=946362 RepID=F2U0J6_SALR5|nr:Sh3yl1-prov protein [Salpingoeca rosetta]EGD80924.1 Sh3yl1-prov protein [Salpingoeca rosetta]|eukprot:XP_004997485.1 Sh3yl1-prov protein [Salpingoeca rosetta]